MATRVEGLSRLERAARALWLESASHTHFGLCDGCGRTHDDEGRPLLVARQNRRRMFECLRCWEERTAWSR
jgi:hypothetical protein